MLQLVNNIIVFIGLTAWAIYEFEDQAWYYSGTIAATLWAFTGESMWHHDILGISVNGVLGSLWTFFAWYDWKNRKNRKNRKKRKLLSRAGYKGRAALLKLVKSMPKPSVPRVPAPVPG